MSIISYKYNPNEREPPTNMIIETNLIKIPNEMNELNEKDCCRFCHRKLMQLSENTWTCPYDNILHYSKPEDKKRGGELTLTEGNSSENNAYKKKKGRRKKI